MTSEKRLAFLFGAGISIPAGYPSTNEISSRVLSGDQIIRHTDGTYYLESEDPDGMRSFDVPVRRVILLLNKLNLEIENYFLYDIDHYTNYEDIYYVVSQLHDSILREYENPITGAFVDSILPDLHKIIRQFSNERNEPWSILELLSESTKYIRDVIWRMLVIKPKQIEYLQRIFESMIDDGIKNIDIFTLNHDILLETALSETDISFNNGFSRPINEVRYWHPNLLASDKPGPVSYTHLTLPTTPYV